MHIGETLMGGATAYSPWFPREADNAIFTVEIIEGQGNETLTVAVFTKNTEDTGPGAVVVGSTSWSTVDSNTSFKAAPYVIGVSAFTGFKELVRFKFTTSGETTQLPVANDEVTLDFTNMMWVRYRMLMPTWFDTAVV